MTTELHLMRSLKMHGTLPGLPLSAFIGTGKPLPLPCYAESPEGRKGNHKNIYTHKNSVTT
jgi:hypothetical protein